MRADVSALKGVVLTSVRQNDDVLVFTASDGRVFQMGHSQDCCEHVYIESIVGELDDLVGEPLLFAEESSSNADVGDHESCTWTFYKFATRKGWVDIRWCGSSNGYYSEGVDFEQVKGN